MATCRYFNTPKGCHRDPCRFLHESTPKDGGSSASVGGKPKHSSGQRPPPPQLSSPPGTCRYFYNYGTCKIADQCKYLHVEPGAPASRRPFFGAVSIQTTPGSLAAPEGSNISGADALHHLATFCSPRITFNRAFQMTSFVKLLTAAGSKQDNWVSNASGGGGLAYL